MAGLYISNLAQNTSEIKSITASSGGLLFTGVDLSNIPGGAVVVNINAITGGTNTATVTLEHSTALGSGYVSVPAAAILNNNTGVATTLSTFSTTGTNQTVAVNRELLRRYLRLNVTGTTITQPAIAFITIGIAANTATA